VSETWLRETPNDNIRIKSTYPKPRKQNIYRDLCRNRSLHGNVTGSCGPFHLHLHRSARVGPQRRAQQSIARQQLINFCRFLQVEVSEEVVAAGPSRRMMVDKTGVGPERGAGGSGAPAAGAGADAPPAAAPAPAPDPRDRDAPCEGVDPSDPTG